MTHLLNTILGTQRGFNGFSPIDEYNYETQSYGILRQLSATKAINYTSLPELVLPLLVNNQKLYISSTNDNGTYVYSTGGRINGLTSLLIEKGAVYLFKYNGVRLYTAELISSGGITPPAGFALVTKDNMYVIKDNMYVVKQEA